MDIIFKTSKLQKICNDQKLLTRTHGTRRAELMRRRLDDLRAATCLEEMRHLKQTRCHELHGNKAGQLSVDLDHPYRLIFQTANNPVPQRVDGGLDWAKVTAVMIIGVEDTHE
ncbi:MAG: type II toxin-antitoxin system RelE/ParE family toxin [Deltaproteobacteria bacterium]|nr:type II toxin-antitoxin system RelE/ParE family toxin [Deltaproteobacteria bacterium]